MKKDAQYFADQFIYGKNDYRYPVPKDRSEGEQLVGLFNYAFLESKDTFLKYNSESDYLRLALEIIPELPQECFDRAVEPVDFPMIEAVLMMLEDDLKTNPEYHKIVEAVMERTHEASACRKSESSSHCALIWALKSGARMGVVKKIIDLSDAQFERVQREWFGPVTWHNYDGALHEAKVHMSADRNTGYNLYNEDAYSDEDVAQIRKWIDDRINLLLEKAKHPMKARVSGVLSAVSHKLFPKPNVEPAAPVRSDGLNVASQPVYQPDGGDGSKLSAVSTPA